MNAFELFGTIAINNSDANSALDETSGKAKKLASAIGNAFATVGKAVVKGAAVSTAAIGTLMTSSIKNYADYEQLVGGVETLFKKSSRTVQKYASDAYKTAGISANDYMSMVTSFSASLLQGLGGDTVAAAEIANMAIVDMSDNANKMGTSIELIQNAYQGFSKQNYTMLDNLKLGYGGTANEMARLINDSGVLGESFKATAENLKEIPFDKQLEAIHAIQTEMGITGTTALEASETISGSWSAMGAAWTNLVVGIADDSQNLDLLIDNFAESALTAFENISARIPSIVKGIQKLIAGIAPMLPTIIGDLLPNVVEGAVGLINGLAKALPGLMQVVIDQIPFIVDQICIAFQETFPVLVEMVASLLEQLGFERLATIIRTNLQPAMETLKSVINSIVDVFTSLVEWISSGSESASTFSAIVVGLTTAVIAFQTAMGIKSLIDGVTTAISSAKTAFAAFNGVLSANPISVVVSLISGLVAAIVYLYNTNEDAREIIDAAWASIKSIFDTCCEGVKSAIQWVLDKIDALKKAWENLKNALTPISTSVSVHYSSSGTAHGGASGPGFAAGAVFDKPTFFNTRLGMTTVGEGGEAEAVAPISVLQGYVSDAVARQNAGLVNALERVVESIESMNENMGSNLRAALDDTSLKINNREFGRLVRTVT